MKALVTGGAGFIGSNLVQELTGQGVDVVVFDKPGSKERKLLPFFKGQWFEGHLSDESVYGRLPAVDVVFHQAAITDTTLSDEEQMRSANVTGSRLIVGYARRCNAPLVYASSAAVYGAGCCPMKEDQELKPLNVYGRSKLEFDNIVLQEVKKGGLPIVGLRYFNVYGPGEQYKGRMASMIWQLYVQMSAGKAPRIFYDGTQKRDHVYIKDVVQANVRAWRSGKSGIYNVGSGQATSFNRLVEVLNDVLGTRFAPEYFENPYSFYQDETLADLTRSRKDLGYVPEFSIEKGIADYMVVARQSSAGVKQA